MITLNIGDPEGFVAHRGEPHPGLEWPIRLNIDGTDIFYDPPRGPYLVVSLLTFARWGPVALAEARARGEYCFYFEDYPGVLHMEMLDNTHVLVHCTITGGSAVADYDELQRTWLAFAQWVRETVRTVRPGIENFPSTGWNRWFEGRHEDEPLRCDYVMDDLDEARIREAKERWWKERGGGS